MWERRGCTFYAKCALFIFGISKTYDYLNVVSDPLNATSYEACSNVRTGAKRRHEIVFWYHSSHNCCFTYNFS